MSRFQHCPVCGEPRTNGAVHPEVPYLAGAGEETVWYCLEAGQHVVVPAARTEHPWAWIERVRALIQDRRKWP